jgi:endoglucanase
MRLKYLLSLLLILPFIASCSDSNKKEDEPTVDFKLLSTSPENGATNVDPDITEIVLTFNDEVSVRPMGYNTITLNGSMIKDDISYSGTQVVIALHNTAPLTTYTLEVPKNVIVNSAGSGLAAFTVQFTTTKNYLDVTPAVSPDATGMGYDAIQWTTLINAGWDLGNSFESAAGDWDNTTKTWSNIWMQDRNEWETAWGNPKTTEAMILAVKEAGFNAVRIPVRWEPHVTNQETMEIDSRWIARVKEVVDYCVNNGMIAIINTHHDLWMENNPFDAQAADISKKEIALWKNIATYFRDYDYHLAFAGTNEVNVNWQAPTTENLRVQNGFNQDFVKAVRSTGGRNWYRNLIVQTYSSNPEYGLNGFVAPSDVVDNRLSVEFHYYSPYDYCGSCTVYYWGSQFVQYGAVSSTYQETALENLFASLSDTWHPQGLGIIMGETGVSYHTTGSTTDVKHQQESMKYYLSKVYSTAKANGIAPFVWDNNAFGNGSENFGIFDRKNGMSVRVSCFLDGIMEGAKTQYPDKYRSAN